MPVGTERDGCEPGVGGAGLHGLRRVEESEYLQGVPWVMVGKAYRNTTVPKSQRPEVLARPSDWRTANKSHMRRKKFLELYAEGFSVKDCCEKLTIGVSAYDHWRKRHPEFAAEVDRIRGTTRMACSRSSFPIYRFPTIKRVRHSCATCARDSRRCLASAV